MPSYHYQYIAITLSQSILVSIYLVYILYLLWYHCNNYYFYYYSTLYNKSNYVNILLILWFQFLTLHYYSNTIPLEILRPVVLQQHCIPVTLGLYDHALLADPSEQEEAVLQGGITCVFAMPSQDILYMHHHQVRREEHSWGIFYYIRTIL